MTRPLKPATELQVLHMIDALALLKAARHSLKEAGASKTLQRVRLTLTSAGGALRHIQRRAQQSKKS